MLVLIIILIAAATTTTTTTTTTTAAAAAVVVIAISLRLQIAQSRYYLQTLDPKIGTIGVPGSHKVL